MLQRKVLDFAFDGGHFQARLLLVVVEVCRKSGVICWYDALSRVSEREVGGRIGGATGKSGSRVRAISLSMEF